jgi:hypothetical protein
LLGTVALASFCLAAMAQDRPDPERLRSDARELMDRARDLKADGKTEESDKLARIANDIIHQADGMQQRRQESAQPGNERRDSRPEPGRVRPSARESGQERAMDRPERPRQDQARARVEAQPLREDRPGPRDGSGPGPRAFAGGERGPQGINRFDRLDARPGDLLIRRYHIKKAIMHLRLAGLNEQADRLEQRLREATQRFRERWQEQRRERPLAPPRPERPADREPGERQ